MNVYAGPNSCYCTLEKIGCEVKGVTPSNYRYYIDQILRDLRRGWSYDKNCRIIPFGREQAVARLLYLIPLMKKHVGYVPKSVEKTVRDTVRSLRKKVEVVT